MQIKIFTLPLCQSERSEDELNKFLRSHRILQTERHFCSDSGGYWTILVEYLEGDPTAEVPPVARKDKRDFSKELSEKEYGRFKSFIAKRKDLAINKGLPAYLVFTNEELAILAKMPFLNEENLKNVKGIAPTRLKDFAQFFFFSDENEEGGTTNAANSR